MGSQLALDAHGFANMHQIPPQARNLLNWMALNALDRDSPTGQIAARSFMTRSVLALGIGRFMPDRKPPVSASPDELRAWERDDKAVKRALDDLKAAGAIRLIRAGHSGRTSEFEVCLGSSTTNPEIRTETVPQNQDGDSTRTHPDMRPAGQRSRTLTVPQKRTQSVHDGGRSVSEKGVHKPSPLREDTYQEEKQGRQPQRPAPPHVQPVDKTASKKDHPRPAQPKDATTRSAVPGPFHGARRSPERVNV